MRRARLAMDELTNTNSRSGIADTLESKDLLELAQLVCDMRDAQRESQMTNRMRERQISITHERRVDKAIAEILCDQERPLL